MEINKFFGNVTLNTTLIIELKKFFYKYTNVVNSQHHQHHQSSAIIFKYVMITLNYKLL